MVDLFWFRLLKHTLHTKARPGHAQENFEKLNLIIIRLFYQSKRGAIGYILDAL